MIVILTINYYNIFNKYTKYITYTSYLTQKNVHKSFLQYYIYKIYDSFFFYIVFGEQIMYYIHKLKSKKYNLYNINTYKYY